MLGAIYGALGLIVGVIFSIVSLFGAAIGAAAAEGAEAAGAIFGLLFGVGAVIILPLFYGAMGFVGGAFAAWIYNLLASTVGGLELEIETNPPPPGVAAP